VSTPDIVVVGSLNGDIVVNVPRLPAPGETVLGGDLFRNPGGKGANQAVAAARLGSTVAMVGAVGDDEAGRELVRALEGDGVDAASVRRLRGVPSGTALISVSGDGENQIVVSSGANSRLGRDDVKAAASVLRAAAVTLVQLEIPVGAVAAACELAGGVVVLNPAPAANLPEDLLARVDVLVPNRMELAQLRDAPMPRSMEEVVALAASLPVRASVITLGAEGALLVQDEMPFHVPAIPVRAIDTTAAGDAFCGALADSLVRSASLEDGVRWAARVAATACMRPGAQSSLPWRDQVI
jgi:ribokinase